MRPTKEIVIISFCILLLTITVHINESVADPYALDLSKTSCLSKDIITGPIGWDCVSESGQFIITFFGINRASIDGTFFTIDRSECGSFTIKELDIRYSDIKISDSKNFSAKESLSGKNPIAIECEYIPPPRPIENFNEK